MQYKYVIFEDIDIEKLGERWKNKYVDIFDPSQRQNMMMKDIACLYINYFVSLCELTNKVIIEDAKES